MDRQKQETDRQGQDTDSTERCAVAVGASLTMMVQKGVLCQDRKVCCFRTERCAVSGQKGMLFQDRKVCCFRTERHAVSGAQDDGESP